MCLHRAGARAGRRRDAGGGRDEADIAPIISRARRLHSFRDASRVEGSRRVEVVQSVKIYTRTGDTGQTSLFDNSRVSKADARVDAYGEIDELNACLGVALAVGVDGDIARALESIQKDLFALGARLADPSSRIAGRVTKAAVTTADVERLEHIIDGLEAELPALRRFILPGGALAGHCCIRRVRSAGGPNAGSSGSAPTR